MKENDDADADEDDYMIMLFFKQDHRDEFCSSRSGKGYAEDYYLDAKSQCAGRRGACPDK